MKLPLALLRTALLLLAAAGAGWLARGPACGGGTTPAPAAPSNTHHGMLSVGDASLIAISDDGRATLRVEQQPLDWVLEEIARQSGRRVPALQAAASGTSAEPAAAPESCPVPAPPAPRPETTRLLQAIESGSEAERYEGLLQAREDSVVLAPQTLKTLYETDASERVRLAAFETWLEQHGGEPEALRTGLEAAALQSGSAVPAEARRRLEELRQMEHVEPDDPQLHPSP